MKKTPDSVFAYRLNQMLASLGISQSELARRVNVTPQAVQRWVSGLSSPRLDTVSHIAELAGKPPHWFFMDPENDKFREHELQGERDSQPHSVTEQPETKNMNLTKEEVHLIEIYRKLPKSEQENMVESFSTRSKEIEMFLAELRKKKNI